MSKRVMTAEESALFNQLKSLVRKANQRMDRLERATGEKEPFASKELADELSGIDALTKKKGRISLKSSYNMTQLTGIKKATEKFLKEPTSTVRGAKKYTKELSEKVNKPLTLKMASTVLQVKNNYEWIYDYYPGSDFWQEYGNPVIKGSMDQGTFEGGIFKKIQKDENAKGISDEDLLIKLDNLYMYLKYGEE